MNEPAMHRRLRNPRGTAPAASRHRVGAPLRLALLLGTLAFPRETAHATIAPPLAGSVPPGASVTAADTSALWSRGRLLVVLEPDAARAARPAHAAASARRAGRDGGSPGARPPSDAGRTGLPELDAVASSLGLGLEPALPGEAPPRGDAHDFTSHWLARLPAGSDPEVVRAALARAPGVASVHRIPFVPLLAIPVDSLWARSWHLDQPSGHHIHALEAWDLTQGDSGVVLAILDSGVLPYHPDLGGVVLGAFGQIAVNRIEQAGAPGVDDDGNGLVDDVAGWDFLETAGEDSLEVLPGEDARDEDPDPNDFASHGTAVAGVAAAIRDNGSGGVGVAPRARILPLRVAFAHRRAPAGVADLSAVVRAIRHATRTGVAAINMSFATVGYPGLLEAVEEAQSAGIHVVVGAGNNGSSHVLSDEGSILSVAATDDLDRLTQFTNLGEYVDLAAPGQAIPAPTVRHVGTDSIGLRQPGYTTGASGTSFSAPIVTAGVALAAHARRRAGLPPLSTFDMKMRVRETSDDLAPANPGAAGYGGGRFNLRRLIDDPLGSRTFPFADSTVGAGVVLHLRSGVARLVVATTAPELVVLDPTTFARLRTLPLPTAPASDLALAALGGGHGIGIFLRLANDSLYGFRPDGSRLPGWPVYVDAAGRGPFRPPALADLDGDGVVEVVLGGAVSTRVYAWTADGTSLASFPRAVPSVRDGSVAVALADLDGLPGAEVLAVSSLGTMRAFRHTGAGILPLAFDVLAPTAAPAVFADADGRARVAVVGNGELHLRRADGAWAVRSFALPDGSAPHPYWDPLAADLDGDGLADLVIPTRHASGGGIAVMGGDGEFWAGRLLRAESPGPPVAGPIRPGGGLGVIVPGPSFGPHARLLALGPSLQDITTFAPKPGRPPGPITLADVDGDDGTEIIAGSSGEGRFYVYEAGRATVGADALAWPTLRGNPARTGSLPSPTPVPMWEGQPPLPVTDLVVDSIWAGGVRLAWTGAPDPERPGEPVNHAIAGAPGGLDPAAFDAAPIRRTVTVRPGERATCDLSGLGDAGRFGFAIRAFDDFANTSAVSPVVEVVVPPEPPARVPDLRASARRDSTVLLSWTATGDDGEVGQVTRYHLRATRDPADSASLARAPRVATWAAASPAGGAETATLRPWDLWTRSWIAIEAEDDVGLTSPLSPTVVLAAGPPPAPVDSLRAAGTTDSTLRVTWRATGEDGMEGRPRRYHLFVTADPGDTTTLAQAAPAAIWDAVVGGGQTETRDLRPFDLWTRSWIAIEAEDEVGNRSPRTVAAVRPGLRPAAVADLRARRWDDTTLVLSWTATGEDGRLGRPLRYHVRGTDAGGDAAALAAAPRLVTVDATVEVGGRERLALRLPRSERRWWFALEAENALGGFSGLSNVAIEMRALESGRNAGLAPLRNPATPPVDVEWSAPAPGARITLHDLAGRVVADLALEGLEGVVRWDGRSHDGQRVPPGVYFARLAGTAARAKLVLMR